MALRINKTKGQVMSKSGVINHMNFNAFHLAGKELEEFGIVTVKEFNSNLMDGCVVQEQDIPWGIMILHGIKTEIKTISENEQLIVANPVQ